MNSDIVSDPAAYALFPRMISVFFYFFALLVLFADIRVMIRYTRVKAKVVNIDAYEEVMHKMAGATHVQHVPEIEFLSKDRESVRMKIYESLLKSYSPGASITVYYRRSEKNGRYKLYFPFSRAKFVLLFLFAGAALFLWEAATW